MSLGTIDNEGFRQDLYSLAQNDYPKLALVKLPFNWFVPQTAGIRQHTMAINPVLSNVQSGSRIVVIVASDSNGAAPATITVTDSGGNTYTTLSTFFLAFSGQQIDILECIPTTVGSLTLSSTSSGFPNLQLLEAIEVGGVLARLTVGTANSSQLIGVQPAGSLIIGASCVSGATPQTWNQGGSGWAALDINGGGSSFLSMATWTQTGDGVTNPQIDGNIPGWGGNPVNQGWVVYSLSTGGTGGIPAPITPVPLPGPCNFFALVSEAIDEQGVYQQSALIGEQAAAGFIRLNGQGNVWIPMSFADPMTPGYVTVNDTYKNCPIVGTGFSSLEAPFGQLDFQPALPVFYNGSPPTTVSYLLAFVGLNVGVGAGIGTAGGDTFGIPSSAGPIARLKDECIFP